MKGVSASSIPRKQLPGTARITAALIVLRQLLQGNAIVGMPDVVNLLKPAYKKDFRHDWGGSEVFFPNSARTRSRRRVRKGTIRHARGYILVGCSALQRDLLDVSENDQLRNVVRLSLRFHWLLTSFLKRSKPIGRKPCLKMGRQV